MAHTYRKNSYFIIFLLSILALLLISFKNSAGEVKKDNNNDFVVEIKIPILKLENSFNDALEVLTNILLPNSLARTHGPAIANAPQNKVPWERAIKIFKTYPKVSMLYLEEKLNNTNSEQQEYSGHLVLEILNEINDMDSKNMIRKIANQGNKIIADWAKEILNGMKLFNNDEIAEEHIEALAILNEFLSNWRSKNLKNLSKCICDKSKEKILSSSMFSNYKDDADSTRSFLILGMTEGWRRMTQFECVIYTRMGHRKNEKHLIISLLLNNEKWQISEIAVKK